MHILLPDFFYAYANVHALLEVARRGHQIHWDCSYRWLCTLCSGYNLYTSPLLHLPSPTSFI